jgi:uncharacterized membrane protein
MFAPLVGTTLVLFALAARDTMASGWPWLAYNLALAWIPLLVGWAATRNRASMWVLGPIWLLFLPNAPYLLTDLVHLRQYKGVPLWFDAMLLGGTGALGLGMGVVSLRMVAGAVQEWWGFVAARLVWLGVPGLVGLGMYLGRFLRWNSWDLWFRPLEVLWSIVELGIDPLGNVKEWAVICTFTAVFLGACLFAPPPVRKVPAGG